MVPKEPHIAALGRDQRLVEWMVGEWRAAGLDSVELATYDMYLSWPNQSDPNKIWLKGSGTQHFIKYFQPTESQQLVDSF